MSAVGGSSSRGLMKRPSIRRVYSADNLPLVRFWFHGPKWRRHCDVQNVHAGFSLKMRPRKILMTSLEEEIRERVLERVYHDRYAMWADARERLLG